MTVDLDADAALLPLVTSADVGCGVADADVDLAAQRRPGRPLRFRRA